MYNKIHLIEHNVRNLMLNITCHELTVKLTKPQKNSIYSNWTVLNNILNQKLSSKINVIQILL